MRGEGVLAMRDIGNGEACRAGESLAEADPLTLPFAVTFEGRPRLKALIELWMASRLIGLVGLAARGVLVSLRLLPIRSRSLSFTALLRLAEFESRSLQFDGE